MGLSERDSCSAGSRAVAVLTSVKLDLDSIDDFLRVSDLHFLCDVKNGSKRAIIRSFHST